MKTTLAAFKALIHERCGLQFEGDGETRLRQAVAERTGILGMPVAAYLPHLHAHEAEFQALVNLLTINETYFFREPEQLRLLVDHLVPRLLAERGDGRDAGIAPVRILSAACSSGEEPYSIAMALRDKYGESAKRLFVLAGSDIDSAVLAKARVARYGEFSFRGVPADVRQRHFRKAHALHVLDDEVKQLVSFHELNLLAGAPASLPRDFDIVLFRNVSIYFDAATRVRIQQNLAGLMKPDGILMPGTAETLANDLGVLPLVEEQGLFYLVKGHPQWAARPAPVAPAPLAALPATPPVPSGPPAPLVTPADWRPPPPPCVAVADERDALRRLVREKDHPAALAALDSLLVRSPDDIEARVLKAHVLLERKEFARATALAGELLAEDEWCIDALLLLGLAAKWRNDAEEGVRRLKQAVYVRHECWPAHYQLADLYRQGGNVVAARRALRVVMQLLAQDAPDTGIRFLPVEWPIGEMRFLCERQLARLEEMATPAGMN